MAIQLPSTESHDDNAQSVCIELPRTHSLSTQLPVDEPVEQTNADGEPSTPTHDLEGAQSASSPPIPHPLVQKFLAMREDRRRWSIRQRLAIVIGILPVAICSLEMIPDRCHLCREEMALDAYFFTAAMCGGFASVIYGDSLDYWMPRLVGGSISALGSLFTVWMLLKSVPTNLAFLFVFVGILGAMPGVLIYFLMKIVADECFPTEVDDYDEIAPLTKVRITSANAD